jgi:type IV pilus assembly protein PilV
MFTSKQAGLTLIEVVITMFIMAVGLLGLAALQSQALKNSLDTSEQSQALWLASELAGRMRANPAGLATGYEAAALAVTNSCNAPPTLCSAHNTGAGSACDAAQMATFDVWEVYCGYQMNNIISGASDTMSLSNIAITCAPKTGANCDTTAVFTLSLFWASKAAIDSAAMSDATADTDQTLTMMVRPQ